MKKKIVQWTIPLLFAAIACMAAACARPTFSDVHIHTFGKWEETAPTCLADGVRVRVCTECGERQETVIPAMGHDYTERVTQSTCTEAGLCVKTCSRCGGSETEKLPLKEHVWRENEVIREATCTEAGLRSAVCEVCGKHENEQEIPANGHTFGEWRQLSAPTCLTDGEKERTCEVCGFGEQEDIPHLGHRFSEQFTVDVEPTEEEVGWKSRHCLNPDCSAYEERTQIDKLKAETLYTVELRAAWGGDLPACVPEICFYDGEELIATKWGYRAEAVLPTKTYTIKASGFPLGYTPAEGEVTPASPAAELRIPAHMIMQKPPLDLQYKVGSVMYDMEVEVVGLTPEEDRKTTLSELFSQYKAVLLNMYFRTCPACVYEMPAFAEAYYTPTADGGIYGEEVACVMLDYYENIDTIRQFKRQTNFYYQNYSGVKDIPMIMIHEVWLRAYFTRAMIKEFPTSVLIDCEGVIAERHAGPMSAQMFTQMMQRGIDRYRAVCAWREEEKGERKEEVSAPEVSVPPLSTVAKRRKEE